MPLSQIKIILQSSEADQYQALNEQRTKIIAEQARLTNLLTSLNQTLATMKGVSIMTDTEKFAAFKTKAISDNEDQYGKEIRKQYGTNVINRSNQKFNALSEEELTHLQKLTQEILTALQPLVGTDDFNQPATKAIFDLHKALLTMTWPDGHYSSEAHKGLAAMYATDPRFTAYYEKGTGKKGAAQTLKAIIDHYA